MYDPAATFCTALRYISGPLAHRTASNPSLTKSGCSWYYKSEYKPEDRVAGAVVWVPRQPNMAQYLKSFWGSRNMTSDTFLSNEAAGSLDINPWSRKFGGCYPEFPAGVCLGPKQTRDVDEAACTSALSRVLRRYKS